MSGVMFLPILLLFSKQWLPHLHHCAAQLAAHIEPPIFTTAGIRLVVLI